MENKITDENDPGVPNTKMSGLRPPTYLKRPIPPINNVPKIPKLSNNGAETNSNKIEDSIIRRQTFIIPNKPAQKPTRTVPLTSTVARNTRSIIKPSNNVSVAPKTNSTVNRSEVKSRPKWDLRGRLEDLEKNMQESAAKSQEQIASLENERTQLKDEIQTYAQKLEELNLIKIELDKEIAKNTETIQEYTNKYTQISLEHQTCAQEILQAKELIKSYNDKIHEQTTYINDTNTKCDLLNTHLNEKTKSLFEAVSQMQELNKKHEICQTELRKEAKELEELAHEYKKLKETYAVKIECYDDLCKKYDSLLLEKEKITEAMNSSHKRYLEMMGELDCLRTTNCSKISTINSLERDIEFNKNTQSMLNMDLQNSKEEVERLKRELASYQHQLAESDVERRLMHHKILELRGTIRVCCRVRPPLSTETSKIPYTMEFRYKDSTMIVASSMNRETVTGSKAESNRYEFSFDRLFGPVATQTEVFDEIDPLVQSALDGYSVCIFAYGQTGSGKTYTMEGDIKDSTNAGMIQRSVNKIFDSMIHMQRKGWEYTVEASFLEIYNETIQDLLVSDSSKSVSQKLEIKMHTSQSRNEKHKNSVCDVYVPNLTCVIVNNANEVQNLLVIANQNRTVAATKCNEFSSRSHSVFRLKLSGKNKLLSETSEAMINLVDLAGSERLNVSEAEGDRLKEAQAINKSLSCLRNVILALSKKESHVPFRDSKLTHLLQSSLGGNCKTLMFANISPLEDHFQETLCSLRFATNVNKCHIGTATQKKTATH